MTTPKLVDTRRTAPVNPLADASPAASGDGDKKARDRLVAAKRLATIVRNKDAIRAELLADIDHQVSTGSLVIRQMTAIERKAGLVKRR